MKSMNMDIWVVGTLNLLFIKDSFNEIKELVRKFRSLWKVHFVLLILFVLKILAGKKTPSNKTLALTKSRGMGILVFGTSNQLFPRGFYAEIKFSKNK